jgi:restriction system protein
MAGRFTVPRKREREFIDSRALSLDEWLKYVEMREEERPGLVECYRFPTDHHFREYVNSIKSRNERQIKLLLRNFLPMGGSFGIDKDRLREYLAQDNLKELLEEYEYVRRLIYGSVGKKQHVWEGLSWVIDLLPRFPAEAISAIEAYDLSHFFILPDGRIHSLSDSVALIRARYLETITEKNLAEAISARDFEFLAASLYLAEGYRVNVTQQTRDGGHDVLAVKDLPNYTERILIECKRTRSPVSIHVARALMGTLDTYRATKAVLISTSQFTAPTTAFAKGTARLELLNHDELCRKFNAVHGAEWPMRISQIIVSAKSQIAKAHEA